MSQNKHYFRFKYIPGGKQIPIICDNQTEWDGTHKQTDHSAKNKPIHSFNIRTTATTTATLTTTYDQNEILNEFNHQNEVQLRVMTFYVINL